LNKTERWKLVFYKYANKPMSKGQEEKCQNRANIRRYLPAPRNEALLLLLKRGGETMTLKPNSAFRR
jgi:hypothetical protein